MIAIVIWFLFEVVTGPSDALERAERAYRAGEFAVAFDAYDEALGVEGVPAGGVLFNMGNCAFRLGRYPQAILHYRRAQLWLPDDRELAFNLQMTEQQLGLEPRIEPSLGGVVLERFDALDLRVVTWLAALLQLVGVLGLRRSWAGGRSWLWITITVVGTTVIGRVTWLALAPQGHDGVVMVAGADLLGEPLAGMPVVTRLRVGELVHVAEMSDRWMRVTCAEFDGWVERASVELVVDRPQVQSR